ncbi:MAG TPA: SemiSWEET transporter [Thermoplasmata archaeon]|nr:SemiSWEET transporter [Thermoplasmata archaeon]
MDATSTWITIVGSISATLTTAAFVPQVVRVWRLRDARDISFTTFAVFSVGLVGWVVYGGLTSSVPVIAANTLTLGLALAILVLKIRFDRPTSAPTT